MIWFSNMELDKLCQIKRDLFSCAGCGTVNAG